jgi:putative DNA primase/helicase
LVYFLAITIPHAEENEKMLGTILIAGKGALAIDNIERTLGGGLISKVLTEEKISVRILGKSEKVDAEPIMLVSFTGNNLKFKNDITARILKCRIDAGMESPEERRFNWDPVIYAMEHRAELVQAVLMILRAYIVHVEDGGARAECTPFGDYVDWSRFVREPLIWLGEPDPVETNKDIKSEDPEKEKKLAVFKAIFDVFPDHIPRPAKEFIKISLLADYGDLRAALMSVGGSRSGDNIDAGRPGGWLGDNKDVTIGSLTLRKQGGERHQSAQWYVENADGSQVQADAHVQDWRCYQNPPTSRAAPCQGMGLTFADLARMPTGGKPFHPARK